MLDYSNICSLLPKKLHINDDGSQFSSKETETN